MNFAQIICSARELSHCKSLDRSINQRINQARLAAPARNPVSFKKAVKYFCRMSWRLGQYVSLVMSLSALPLSSTQNCSQAPWPDDRWLRCFTKTTCRRRLACNPLAST